MGHMGPSQSYHPQVPTSMGEIHPPSNPTVRHGPHLTPNLEGSLEFNASTLKAPFSFMHACPPESLISKLPKEPKISPHGFDLQTFQLILDIASKTSEVLKSQTLEGSTLTCGDILDVKARTGGSQVLHPPNGPRE
jgi:hypothetical protein